MSTYLFAYYACMILAGANFCMMFVAIFMCLYLGYVKIDYVLSYFKNSPAIISRVPLRHGGPWGRILLVGAISGFVVFPQFYIRNGGGSSEDLDKLPGSLRKMFVFIQWGGIISLGLMFLLFGISKILRPHVVF